MYTCLNRKRQILNFRIRSSGNIFKYFFVGCFTYTLRIDQARFEWVSECSCFVDFECSRDAVLNMSRLEFRFQNLPCSNLIVYNICGQKVPFSCEREAARSLFSPFAKYAGIGWT